MVIGDVDVPWTTERKVKETKAVLAWLHVKVWPWLSVDFVDIAELVEVFADREGKVTIVVVCSVLECEDNVVVVLGELQGVLLRVIDNPNTSKTIICVVGSDVVGVILNQSVLYSIRSKTKTLAYVVPHGSRGVIIRVVVILELVGQKHIVSPPIPRRVSVGTVKMHRCLVLHVVVKTNDGLATSWDPVCWSGRDTIVSDEAGVSEIRVDLLLVWLNGHLIKVDVVSIDIDSGDRRGIWRYR